MTPRRLVQSDAKAMSALHAKSFDRSWSEDEMKTHIEMDQCLGVGQPLSGFVITRSVAEQSEILTIVVDEHKRGQGIAKTLLRACEGKARTLESTVMFLEVAEDNSAAIRLYEGSGYVRFGRRPAYYRRKIGRVAALTYRKDLDVST